MKHRGLLILALVLAVLIGAYFIITKVFDIHASKAQTEDFAPYISGYTSGVVSKSATVKIQLSHSFAKELPDIEEREKKLLDIDPDIPGEGGWLDYRTYQFSPEKHFDSGEEYGIRFKLGKLDSELDRKFRDFEFPIRIKAQNFSVHTDVIETTDLKELRWQKLTGTIRTADTEDPELIKKILQPEIGEKKLDYRITQRSSQVFSFIIDSIPRTDERKILKIKYDGSPVKVQKSGTLEVEVPSLEDFTLISTEVVQYPEQYVRMQFSDPLDESQYLGGLISLGEIDDLKFRIDKNIIKVYLPSRLDGEYTLIVNEGIKNILGKTFTEKARIELRFEKMLPAVRMTGKGVIMPKKDGQIVMPFEAVNLKAVDVQITKIYENNIMQFLQVNDFDDDYQLQRVGKVVKQKTLPLTNSMVTNLGSWNRFTLKLNELINSDPGAIYRVEISFRKKHAIYPCGEENSEEDNMTTSSNYDDENFWDHFDDYYYASGWGNWEHRDNPCHDAYYGHHRAVSRNIFTSNMGIVAKRGYDHQLLIWITDMLSTEPLKDVELKIYDYQQQLISEGETDKNGFFSVKNAEDAWFVLAKKASDRGYLRLREGSNLSVSNFDVSGADVRKGMKGFIYTERGVWRPGDSVYVSFMLHDMNAMLPESHPITFKLTNPKGQLVDRQVQHLNDMHLHSFRTHVPANAPTGYYNAQVILGGKTFYKSLRIETIKPNRLKMELDIPDDKLLEGRDNKAQLTATWLHGSPGKGLKARLSLSLYPLTTSFEKFEGYCFDDRTKSFSYTTTNVMEGSTDGNGSISGSINPGIGKTAPGKLSAKITAKVFEKGGNFSIQEFQFPYHPYTSYIGFKVPSESKYRTSLSTGKTHNIKIRNVTQNGKLLHASHQIKVSLYKTDWSWWYDYYRSNASFNSSRHVDLIKSETLHTKNGKANWEISLEKEKWGYYFLYVEDMETGHSASEKIYVDWPQYMGIGRRQASKPDILRFKADKESYKTGEKAKIRIPGSEEGRALISIENGIKVLDHFWIDTDAGDTEFTVNLTEEMAPNLYVHVHFIQAHSNTSNDRPIRMYGIIPISVEYPDSHLHPEIDMPETLRAESSYEMEVSEADGKDMNYTIAVVDEGLLSLTGFTTPDPWHHFYAKEALGVKTWDMYDWVIGAFGAEVERMLNIGGGGSLDKESARKAKRFTPVVKFLGPFHLKGGKTATHKIRLPRYIGAVRTMVVAGNIDGAFGNAEKITTVKKPLMVLGSMPRVMRPGEKCMLPVTVFAMEDNVKDVRVKVSTNKAFSLTDGNTRSLHFNKPGESTLMFPLKAIDKTGLGKIEILAQSGSETAEYEIEMDVRYSNPPMSNVEASAIAAGASASFEFDRFGLPGTDNTSLELYAIPPLNLHKRMKYLTRYPHACIEQMVSAAFPQLYLDVLTKTGEDQKEEIQLNVNSAITRLRNYQMGNGGFAYWPGAHNVNTWGTSYAGHFMLEAKDMGYDIPDAVLKAWFKYQRKKSNNWVNDGTNAQVQQAYRLYTLALYGRPNRSAMNRMRHIDKLDTRAGWRLAAAYLLSGKENVAETLIRELSTNTKAYTNYGATFGSSYRDKAMILETLILTGNQEASFKMLRRIAEKLGSQDWISTHTAGYCLMAAGKYVKNFDISSEIRATYQLNGKQKELNSRNAVLQTGLHIKASDNKLRIENTGKGMLYARLVKEGIPAPGNETAITKNLRLHVNYKYPDGSPLNIKAVEQGTDFVCEIRVTHIGNKYRYNNLALTHIFPSGWELINSRLFSTQLGKSDTPEHEDMRDDRIYTYFSINAKKTKVFRYMFNAGFAGKYYLPAVKVEDMYDSDVQARNTGRWTEVKQVE